MDADPSETTPTMTTIEHHSVEDDARARAASLVAQGIGAQVDRDPDAFPGGTYAVSVLTPDAPRARQVLGLEPVEEVELDEEELTRSARPWLIPALVIAAAFVVIPLAAFYLSYKLQGG